MAATSKIVPTMWKLLCIFVLFTEITATRLNVPKVLLPYYSFISTNFTLEVNEGCLKWRSSRPEIATVVVVNHHGLADPTASCSSKAVVTAVSKTPNRMTSVVIAEDPVSGQQLRCDVIVDVIHSIYVETTTRELYLEDSPEQFIVRALDDEGNVFSSLEGVAFDWSLISDTDVEQDSIVDAHNVLRILPFAESHYETPPYIATLEGNGKQGDSLLVEGIRTGSAKVSARLNDPVYKGVNETIVRLIVIANIILNPPLVYVLRHCQVHYKVELFKQGKTQEIPMPSQQYYLDIKDGNICDLERANSTVTAKEIGYTELVLKDRNIKVKEAFRQPTAGIYVVTPGYLGFVVLPGRKWVLETKRDYEILIEIYDKDSHKIYPSENVRVIADFPEDYFKVYTSTINGTHHYVRTLKRGTTLLEGQLKAVLLPSGEEIALSPVVRSTQDVEIYDPIHVVPPILIFPWDPVYRATYNYQLQARGGSGNYTWSSSETSVAAVNVRGRMTTSAVGVTTVTAADVRNNAHTGNMKTYVLPPSEMHFVPSRVEAEIGTYLELPLAVFAHLPEERGRHMFADCRQLPFTIRFSDHSVFQHVQEVLPLEDGSCTLIKVMAQRLGHTDLTVLYEHEKIRLSATITIAAYKPLQPLDPEDVAVISVGASKDVIFEGGPQPWVVDKTRYYQNALAEREDVVKMTHLNGFGTQKTLHMFRVVCRDLGEQDLSVTVGNGPTSKNKFPAQATSSVRLACARPVGLHLSPLVRHPAQLPPCPISADSPDSMPVPNYQSLDILVTVTDSNGRRFDNFSSLLFDWHISDQSLASFGNSGEMQSVLDTTVKYGRSYLHNYQLLEMKNKLGTLSVTASIKEYKRHYLQQHSIVFEEQIDPPITATLDLMAIEDAKITPEFISIFNHPSNKAILTVSGGSGYFHIDHNHGNIARIAYDAKTRGIEVTPVHDGAIVITAYDLCVESVSPAQSQVHISGVNAIDLQVVDKVELHKEIKARVRVLDKNGKPLLASYFPLMGLKPQTGSDFITLREDPDKSDDPYVAQYIVYGASLGRTNLHFTARPPSAQLVSSRPREIQVFPPLRLDPRNITVIIGALFQVTAHGGPQPESDIEFTIEDGDIAKISNSGLIDALEVGKTTVTGRAVGYEGEAGRKIVYSQDQVTVHVVELEGVRIFAPLKRLQTGTQMPLYAVGLNEHETPFTFGSALPPLTFHWKVNSKQTADLRSIYYKSGVKMPDESNFAVQLAAKRAGQVTVSLTVTPDPDSRMQIKDNARLHDEVQIQVFEELMLTSPDKCSDSILVTPNTETQVRTNRDGTAKMTYEIVIDGEGPKSSTGLVVMVNDAGQLISGSRTGQATLKVTAREDFGVNQTVVILVRVKPVSYLMLNADTVINTNGYSLSVIPVGTRMQFTVTYHDDVGDKFFATNTILKYRPNRFDLVHVSAGAENGTLLARMVNPGQTVLKVWDEHNLRMADYISINTGYAIQPAQAQLTLGDIVCFSTPVVSQNGHAGKWASNNGVLTMRSQSGVGTAAQIGTSIIKYDLGDSLSTYTEVVVVGVSKLQLRNENVQHLSNVASRNKASVVPVVLEDGHVTRYNNLVGTNCSKVVQEEGYSPPYMPFRCELSMSNSHPDISIQDLLHVAAHFDPTLGQYECRITQAGIQDLTQLISTLDIYVQLRAVVPERENQPEVSSPVISFPFMPAFYVHTSEIQVSNLLPLTSIRVSTMDRVKQDLKVSSSDTSLVEVLTPEQDTQSDHVVHFPIRLQDRQALWELDRLQVKIEVKCFTTGQTQTIPVRIKLIGQKQDQAGVPLEVSREAGWGALLTVVANNYHSWMWMLLCVFITVSAVFIAYHATLGPRYQAASQQAGVFLNQTPTQVSPGFHPSPWNSPYSTGSSPSKVPLWTSGYDLSDSQINRRSPTNRSPYNRSPYQS